MTREEAIRILDPETSTAALVEIEYYHGFAGHIARVEAVNEACKIAVADMRKLAALENHSQALESNGARSIPVRDLYDEDGQEVAQ